MYLTTGTNLVLHCLNFKIFGSALSVMESDFRVSFRLVNRVTRPHNFDVDIDVPTPPWEIM